MSAFFSRLFRNTSPRHDRKAARRELGTYGEKVALNHLRHEGYRIRALNYTVHNIGEVDIIAQEKDTIAFVEVRTLSEGTHDDSFSTLVHTKRRNLTKTARHYLRKYRLESMAWRFDFVSVIIGEDRVPHIELFRDAFPPV
jgi:putative endonuclease